MPGVMTSSLEAGALAGKLYGPIGIDPGVDLPALTAKLLWLLGGVPRWLCLWALLPGGAPRLTRQWCLGSCQSWR